MCYSLEYRTCLNPVLKNKINIEHNASSFLLSKRERVTASVSTKGGVGRVPHSPIFPFPHWTVLPRREGLVALRLLLLHAAGVHGHLLHPHDLWDAQQEKWQLADCPQRTPQAGKSPQFPGTRPRPLGWTSLWMQALAYKSITVGRNCTNDHGFHKIKTDWKPSLSPFLTVPSPC